MARHVLTRDGAIVYDFTDGGTPPPGPTPPPAGPTPPPGPVTPPPSGVVEEVHLGAKDTMKAEKGVKYTAKLPFPFSVNAAVQIGASPEYGASPTAIWMAISDRPGGGLEQAPTPADSPAKISGDVNAGLTIYASLAPTPGRGGNYQATVTPDAQYWVSWVCPLDSGGVVYSIALG